MKKLILIAAIAAFASQPLAAQNIRPDSSYPPAMETTPIQLAPIQLEQLTKLYERAAYVSGRCFNYLSDDTKLSIRRQIGNTEYLMKIYYDAIQESRKSTPTLSQCQKVLTNVETAIKRLTG